MTRADDAVPTEELTAEDRAALGWAVSSGHPLGAAIVDRLRGGGTGVTAGELGAVRDGWERAGRPAPQHHVHRTSVVLPDGTSVTGATFPADGGYVREERPSFGLYLDERWSPPWEHGHLEWPDFGVPADVDALRTALLDVLERARRGGSVEVGCLGGHGRTGTALACLAVLTGVRPADAVAWVRAHYCEKAVETHAQEALVAGFSP